MTGRVKSYMRTLRLKAGLSQAELGRLIGVSATVIGNCERQISNPTATVLLGCSLVFGAPAAELFPVLYKSVQESMGRHAAELDERWRHRTDPVTRRKMEFFGALARRSVIFPEV